MKYLTLLRHAKSSWSNPDLSDFDRPLNKRGQRDAPKMACRLANRGLIPDLILVSPALRARLTAEAVIKQLAVKRKCVIFDERIYMASADELMEILRTIEENQKHVLLVGHNPGISELANFLVENHQENMPTCSVVSIELSIPNWQKLSGNESRLLYYDYPKKSLGKAYRRLHTKEKSRELS